MDGNTATHSEGIIDRLSGLPNIKGRTAVAFAKSEGKRTMRQEAPSSSRSLTNDNPVPRQSNRRPTGFRKKLGRLSPVVRRRRIPGTRI